jgi:aromatic-L-amino-acid decarboxylase
MVAAAAALAGGDAVDLRQLQVPLGRRFRAIKLWFVLRGRGLACLRAELRAMVAAAERLAAHARGDARIVVVTARLGLVGMRAAAGDAATRALEDGLHGAGYHVSHGVAGAAYFLRISISTLTENADVDLLWSAIARLLA